MTKRPDVFLEIAVDALTRVTRYLGGRGLDEYLADDQCQSAVERQLEVAGDALGRLRRLSPEWFAQIPEGDVVVGFRNVLAHGYAMLDHRRIYQIACVRAPELLQVLEALLAQIPEQDEPLPPG
jgi:uncharacterized protein with HEPN domain